MSTTTRMSGFARDCLVLMVVCHFKGCDRAAAEADRWTEEELIAAVEWP